MRNLGGLALVACASILVAACATDGAGNPGGLGGPEGPGNSSEHPGSSYDGPGSNGSERAASGGTEQPANCSATLGDLLHAFSDFCEECGISSNPEPDPEIDNQAYVRTGYTASAALDRVVNALPLTRTRGNAETQGGPFDGCGDLDQCLNGGCGELLNETVVPETNICVGSYINCLRAVFAMIPCDGDVSGLEGLEPPAACDGLFEEETTFEPEPTYD